MADRPSDAALAFEAVKINMRQSKDGWALVLALHPDDVPEELFRSLTGARYQVAMVELDTNDQPLVRSTTKRDPDVMYAVALCKEPAFQAWVGRFQFGGNGPFNEEDAAAALRVSIGAKSRSQIGTDPEIRDTFLKLVAAYKRDEGID